MASMTASINDSRHTLLLKAAWNLYNYAINQGGTGFNPPSWNDNDVILIKKMTYYTASLA